MEINTIGDNVKATAEKICSVYCERVLTITVRAAGNWFVKFCPSEFDDNLLMAILEQNPCQTREGMTSKKVDAPQNQLLN